MFLKRSALCIIALAAASCSDEPTAAEREAISDAKIAAVEAAQIVPAEELAPQPIGSDLLMRENIGGAGCAFTPANGLSGPVLVTRPDLAYMRLGDQMVRFAADKGSARLPLDGWTKYVGKARSLQLAVDSSGEAPGASDMMRGGDALLVVKDERERIIFEADGKLACGS